MTKTELTEAFAMSRDNPDNCVHFGDIWVFAGYGLHGFKPVHCRLIDIARLLLWQCQNLDGSWDMEEMGEIAKLGRKLFIIVG